MLLSFSLFSNDKIVSVQDSLKIEKYKNHINTLQYISRQNYNTEFFLDLALKYVDSIFQLQDDNTYASEIEETILLTKNTIDNNIKLIAHDIEKLEFELYDLSNDPTESIDISKSNSQVFELMKNEFMIWNNSVDREVNAMKFNHPQHWVIIEKYIKYERG